MHENDIIKKLKTLSQWEIDCIFVFEHAAENLNNDKIRQEIFSMKRKAEDNIRRINKLFILSVDKLIKEKYGKESPRYTKDFKGFFMQGYAAVRGLTGDKGVLEALDTNLKMVFNAFESSLKMNFPEEIRNVLKEIYEQKKEWLEKINRLKKLN